MPDSVIKLIEELLDREGGYVNDPRDRGGETKYGITAAVARKNGYAGKMEALSRGVAMSIYRQQYWVAPGFKSVAAYYPRVAAELFDTGVNMGPAVAITFLQRSLNALNNQGKLYHDIAVDGGIGPSTLSALHGYRDARGADGEGVLLKALEVLQGERYITLAEGRPANEGFLYGWLANRIGNVA